jgi:hypothetical protein
MGAVDRNHFTTSPHTVKEIILACSFAVFSKAYCRGNAPMSVGDSNVGRGRIQRYKYPRQSNAVEGKS